MSVREVGERGNYQRVWRLSPFAGSLMFRLIRTNGYGLIKRPRYEYLSY